MNITQLLNSLADRYSFSSYLELGCDDAIFSRISLTDKTGVHPTAGGNFRGSASSFFASCARKYDLILLNDVVVQDNFHAAISRLNDNGCLLIIRCVERWRDILEIRQLEEVDSVTIIPGMIVLKRPNSKRLMVGVDEQEFEQRQGELLRVIDESELLEFLPPVTNPRNIWLSMLPEWGRIGHQFNDIVSGPILADIFGLGYHYTGFYPHEWGEEMFNYYFNFADFFDKHSIEEPACDIYTPDEKMKWWGMPLTLARQYLRGLPSGTSVILRRSTFFGFKQLFEAEQQGDTLPGLYQKNLRLWESLIKRTNFYNFFASDFEATAGVLNVAVYVRGGGRLHDNGGRIIPKSEYDRVLDRVRDDHPGKRLNVVYYTQGPVNDLVGDFVGENVKICDQVYPRLYRVAKSMIDADVFVAGMSSFSAFISAFRDKPSYYLKKIPFRLPEKDIVV